MRKEKFLKEIGRVNNNYILTIGRRQLIILGKEDAKDWTLTGHCGGERSTEKQRVSYFMSLWGWMREHGKNGWFD